MHVSLRQDTLGNEFQGSWRPFEQRPKNIGTVTLWKVQGCGTRKFEDGSGSDIFSDYGSGSSSGSYTCIYIYEYVHVYVYVFVNVYYTYRF
jgi:hypothetical protein